MSKSASSSDPSDIWSQQDCFDHCEQFITSYAKDTELFDDSEDSLCCNYAQLTDGYSCDLVVSKTVTNVDPGTQDSGESSKAKLFTPDVAPEKTSMVPAWLAIIMTTFDMGSNILVPAAGRAQPVDAIFGHRRVVILPAARIGTAVEIRDVQLQPCAGRAGHTEMKPLVEFGRMVLGDAQLCAVAVNGFHDDVAAVEGGGDE